MYIENYIKKIVDNLVSKMGTSNPEELIKGMKNVNFTYELLSDELNGYYLYISEKKQIVRVHENLNYSNRQYVVSHEIGHCALKHRGTILFEYVNTISNRKEEYEADLFATYLFIRHNEITKENLNEFMIPERIKDLIYKFLD